MGEEDNQHHEEEWHQQQLEARREEAEHQLDLAKEAGWHPVNCMVCGKPVRLSQWVGMTSRHLECNK